MDFPYGTLVTEVPPEFVPVEVWPEYGYIAMPPPICAREYVAGDYRAVRWSLWPITFEQYIADDTPDLIKSRQGKLARNRFVMWRRIRRTDTPAGWVPLSKLPPQIDGFKLVGDDPLEGWNHDARKGLRVWQRRHNNITHTIEKVGFEEYRSAYMQSLIAKRVNDERIRELSSRLQIPEVKPFTELWGVRELATGKLIAGTAVICSPTHKGSTHFAPFIHQEARKIYAATALIHHWFLTARARGDTFVVTTNFWFPGKPKSWKGFSEFKSHFGWQYIAYPPTLWKFVPGKLF